MNHAPSGKSIASLRRIVELCRTTGSQACAPGLLDDSEAAIGDLEQLTQTVSALAQRIALRDRQLSLLKRVIPIGVALSTEKDFDRLLETLVIEAQSITNADGGSLYLRENDTLRFVILRNRSLRLQMGGTTGEPISVSPVRLYNDDGRDNRANVASCVALTRETIRIADAYEAEGFDFSGTKLFDARMGYRSRSMLAMPLMNGERNVIGVLQLLNAQDPETAEIVPFAEDEVLESLVLLAAAALDGYIREASLRHEIVQLRIEIDETRRAHQVAEITDTSYFRDLKMEAARLRSRRPRNDPGER